MCAISPGLIGFLADVLDPLPFAMCFAASEERPGGILALPNAFLKTLVAQRYRAQLDAYASAAGLGAIAIVVDPTVSAAPDPEPAPEAPRHQFTQPVRTELTALTTRLFAERGFWQRTPLAPAAGRATSMTCAAACRSMPAPRARVGRMRRWCSPSCSRSGATGTAEPLVECGLRRLAGVLGLAWGRRTATQLRPAVERLKKTTYRVTVADEDGGRERLFSLLDEIETSWVEPPTTIHRRIRAVVSRTAWEAISEPRIVRTVDLTVLRALGARRELARCVFYLLEAQPGRQLSRGVEVVERLVDARLLASLGTQRPV